MKYFKMFTEYNNKNTLTTLITNAKFNKPPYQKFFVSLIKISFFLNLEIIMIFPTENTFANYTK